MSTTYIPVTKPAFETLVRSSPSVCSTYPPASSTPASAAAHAPSPADAAHARRARKRERHRRDPEAQRQEREERIQLDRVLDLDERDAPDGGHRNERQQDGHRAIQSAGRRYQNDTLLLYPVRQCPCSTPSAARCAIFASRSRTGATSAAPTACRRRCSARTTASSTARSCSRSRRSPGSLPHR